MKILMIKIINKKKILKINKIKILIKNSKIKNKNQKNKFVKKDKILMMKIKNFFKNKLIYMTLWMFILFY